MSSEEQVILAVKLLFVLLGLGAVGLFVVLPIVRMLRRTEEIELVMKPFEPPPETEIEIPVDGWNTGKQKPDRDALLQDVRADPRRAAMIMQQWLREKKKGGRPGKDG